MFHKQHIIIDSPITAQLNIITAISSFEFCLLDGCILLLTLVDVVFGVVNPLVTGSEGVKFKGKGIGVPCSLT